MQGVSGDQIRSTCIDKNDVSRFKYPQSKLKEETTMKSASTVAFDDKM